MKKGQRIVCTHYVVRAKEGDWRSEKATVTPVPFNEPVIALFIGWSHRTSGITTRYPAGFGFDSEPPIYAITKTFKVAMVVPARGTRYLKPVPVLPEHIQSEAVMVKCPICGGSLQVDVAYMQEHFGENWHEVALKDQSLYCEGCGEAGLYEELFDIALDTPGSYMWAKLRGQRGQD